MTTTIGILYPGEMGSALGSLLAAQGCRVVTTVRGRSARTHRLCEQANLTVLSSLAEVVQSADIIVSLVPPAAAEAVARESRQSLDSRTRPAIYVDANSVSPMTIAQIAAAFAGMPVSFVDAAIHGLASQLHTRGTIYLSGNAATEIAGHFSLLSRVAVVGDQPGQASLLKMLLGGMSKGMIGLFLELACAAHQAGVMEELLVNYREFYPGFMEIVDRLLPTYPRHAARRAVELTEIAATLRSIGSSAGMIQEAQKRVAAVASLQLCDQVSLPLADTWEVTTVIETICNNSASNRNANGLASGMSATHSTATLT